MSEERGLATCIAVYQASWLGKDKWQWSVTDLDGPAFGEADSKAEAWEKAREYHAAVLATGTALRRARGHG